MHKEPADPVERYVLGPEAYGYILECLDIIGKGLARAITTHVDLNRGTIETYLCPGLDRKAQLEFQRGGKADRDRFDFLADLAIQFLSAHSDGVCLLENALAGRSDPGLKSITGRLRFHQQDVYHVVLPEDIKPSPDKPQLIANLRRANAWLVLGVFSRLDPAPAEWPQSPDIDSETLIRLGAHADVIVVGAYDGESFLVWRRGTAPPPVPAVVK